jgi:5-dehydro-2-deoxygluconokinase
VIESCDPHCKGVVLLGLDAEESALLESFAAARAFPLFRGFAVGRSIFRPAAEQWFGGSIDDAAARRQVAERYLRLIEGWRESGRKPSRAADSGGRG